ncbi:biotin--[acetyl-CoA-carboxylase] ligase [Lawsonella clevelandensis]|uniref:biotin--[biotin carboxyl-carrier protein] ligase n=1 Tax=Lawsonella clevelandensis TaxID=1528099 RepID=A0A5E3ZZA6_9ACTN|nr:biotin--[acetyl-CoA-carboxylase] ligase [Lawsonella clevelandensis]VHO01262.1 Bifunctional ligase/repressor BirA [Lawsonella clevelandensis]
MPLVPTRPLDVALLRAALVDTPATTWQSLEVADVTGSTNSDMVQRASADLTCDRALLLAEYQTNGRGRYTRSFVAPHQSSISFSALIRTGTVSSQRWALLPLATGVAVIDGLRRTLREAGIDAGAGAGSASGTPGEIDLSLKWPNDILCNGGKLAGMLVEMAAVDRTFPDGSSAAAIVPGVGINVTQSPDELPVDYAVSLAMVLGDHTPSREDLAIAIFTELDRRVQEWWRGDTVMLEDYNDRCSTIGQEVDIQLPDGVMAHGTAVDVAEDGCLLLRTANGAVQAVRAGDVRHVRGGGCYLP